MPFSIFNYLIYRTYTICHALLYFTYNSVLTTILSNGYCHYKWGNCSSERLNNQSKDIEQISDRAGRTAYMSELHFSCHFTDSLLVASCFSVGLDKTTRMWSNSLQLWLSPPCPGKYSAHNLGRVFLPGMISPLLSGYPNPSRPLRVTFHLVPLVFSLISAFTCSSFMQWTPIAYIGHWRHFWPLQFPAPIGSDTFHFNKVMFTDGSVYIS